MKIGKRETQLGFVLGVFFVSGFAGAQTVERSPSFDDQVSAAIERTRAASVSERAALTQAPYDVDAVLAAGIHCEISIFDSKSPLDSPDSNDLNKYASIRVALKTVSGTKTLSGTYEESSYAFKTPVKFGRDAWPPSQEALDQAVAGMQPASVSKPLSGLDYAYGEGSACVEHRFPNGGAMGLEHQTLSSECKVYPQVAVKGKGFELAFQIPHYGVWTRTSTTDYVTSPPSTYSNEIKRDVFEYVGPDGLVGSDPELKTKLSRVKTGSGAPGAGELVGDVLSIGNVSLAKALFGGGFGSVDQIGACHLDSN